MTQSIADLRFETRKNINELVEKMKSLQAKIQTACDAAGDDEYFDEKGEVSWDMVSDFCGQSVTDAIDSVDSCLVEPEEEEEEEVAIPEPKAPLTAEERKQRVVDVFAKLGVQLKK